MPEHTYHTAPAEPRSAGALLRDLAHEVSSLFRQEVALAKQETSEKVSTATRNGVYVAIGAGVVWLGAVILLMAASAALFVALWLTMPWYHALWVSLLIIGAVVAIIGAAFTLKGIATLKHQRLAPQQTIDTFKEDKQWLQNEARK